jgi:hypothetical protein
MDILEFKQRVRKAFGPEMEHATPANVREFIDGIQREMWRKERADHAARTGSPRVPIELDGKGGPATYEGTVREFFAHALKEPNEQALILLWMYALDMAYSGIEEMQSEAFNQLFVEGPNL